MALFGWDFGQGVARSLTTLTMTWGCRPGLKGYRKNDLEMLQEYRGLSQGWIIEEPHTPQKYQIYQMERVGKLASAVGSSFG